MGYLIAAGIIAAGGAIYAGSEQKKAAKEANAALGGMQTVDLQQIPFPETVDWQETIRNVIGTNTNNLPEIFNLANRTNQFNVNQAVRGYSTVQPYFKQLQEQIGRNALSFARGELPGDVTSSIGRAAASRGFANGIGMGSRGGGFNTALGGLNLRNLGLTSLQLSQGGTQMAMDVNSRAAAMTPSLFDPSSMMMSPNAALGISQFNAGVFNDWNRANTQIANAEASGNTQLLNSIINQQAQNTYAARVAAAQAVQSASSSVAGLMGGAGGAGGGAGGFASLFGGGGGGGGNTGQINSFNQSQQALATGTNPYLI